MQFSTLNLSSGRPKWAPMTLGWYSKFINILENLGGLWCCPLFPLNALSWAPFFFVWAGREHGSTIPCLVCKVSVASLPPFVLFLYLHPDFCDDDFFNAKYLPEGSLSSL